MALAEQFPAVFQRLKGILQPYQSHFRVTADALDHYSLYAPLSAKNTKELFFGAVQVKKSYVSFHLMPVYLYPDLLKDLSPGLRARMQGKSCFNFKVLQEAEHDELARLTNRSFERLEAEALI